MKRLSCSLLLICTLLGASAAEGGTQVVPEFQGITQWMNSTPLTMASLRGKVVLIDFWAYSCINCLRAMPHVEHLYKTYRDQGLVVVGVHSPEFDFESNPQNVASALARLGITYPVAIDNNLRTWNAWHNEYWPAEYLIDQNGMLIGHQYGEGNYLRMENAVRLLLGMGSLQASGAVENAELKGVGSPEMALGSNHQKALASPEGGRNGTRRFTSPARLTVNKFALSGVWEITDQYARTAGKGSELTLRFKAGKLHVVASAGQPIVLAVSIDGKPQPSVTIEGSRLYTLFDSNDYGVHQLRLRIEQPGVKIYTLTFG